MMQEHDSSWLMNYIELLTSDPESANFSVDTSRCDLEIVIKVAEEDKPAFTQEVLDDLKKELCERTGVTPTIYLEGNEPEWLAKGAYI